MNGEIKFRFYIYERGMFYVTSIKWVEGEDYVLCKYYPFIEKNYPKEIQVKKKELMQYTRLKDKNGKEVYEGDIVKYGVRKYEVKWHIDRFGMQNPKSSDYLWFDNYPNRERNNQCEVIGNIYENPELIKL